MGLKPHNGRLSRFDRSPMDRGGNRASIFRKRRLLDGLLANRRWRRRPEGPHVVVRPMEFRQLRSFLAVAECGSFSGAAQLLGVTQPALSRQICLLEQALSQRLFHRNGRGAALNAAGRVFMGHARAILAGIEEAQREVSALREAPQGEVRIGLSPSTSATLLRHLIASVASDYPRIKIHVEERFSDDLSSRPHRVDGSRASLAVAWPLHLPAGQGHLRAGGGGRAADGIAAPSSDRKASRFPHHPGACAFATLRGQHDHDPAGHLQEASSRLTWHYGPPGPNGPVRDGPTGAAGFREAVSRARPDRRQQSQAVGDAGRAHNAVCAGAACGHSHNSMTRLCEPQHFASPRNCCSIA